LHWACLQDAVRLVVSIPNVQPCLFVAGSPKQAQDLARNLRLPRHWRVQTQRGRDLGLRLHNAFAQLLLEGHRSVIVIGTDTPWMGKRVIQRAARLLRRGEVVLGPTEDGGYYLVGARRAIPQMFNAIDWGSARVFRQTLAALAVAGVRPGLLPRDFDLDRPADITRLRRSARPRLRGVPNLVKAIRALRPAAARKTRSRKWTP